MQTTNSDYLAAQAGVRYSIENPHAYAESNIIDLQIFLKHQKIIM